MKSSLKMKLTLRLLMLLRGLGRCVAIVVVFLGGREGRLGVSTRKRELWGAGQQVLGLPSVIGQSHLLRWGKTQNIANAAKRSFRNVWSHCFFVLGGKGYAHVRESCEEDCQQVLGLPSVRGQKSTATAAKSVWGRYIAFVCVLLVDGHMMRGW